MSSLHLSAQDDPYRFTFAPDLWYNDVDGIRVGVRTLGEVEGTFKDGPHRLDAGVWIGTWLPENPVSYYVSFIEPIKAISDYGNEASIQIISSIRTGYSQHKVQFNKRWQPGFDEYEYKEISLYFSQEKMFNSEYRPFPQLWTLNQKTLLGLNINVSKSQNRGQFFATTSLKQNINQKAGSFTVGTIELSQRFDLSESFKFKIRGFAGYSSEGASPEYRFMSSMNPAQSWLDKGVSRAKGTIPMPWLESGSFQVGGGANLRGYTNYDIEYLQVCFFPLECNVILPLYQSIIATNLELYFPNFVDNKINNISIIGDLIKLDSYLFFDIGRGYNYTEVINAGFSFDNGYEAPLVYRAPEKPLLLADAGLGLQFSFNIPDYLGKDRGIFIRYDIPFWLSDPSGSDSNFAFRQLVGLGAIISF